MLSVAHLTLWLRIGGAEQLLVEMARHRDRARFEWTVIVLDDRGPLADGLEADGVRVISLDAGSGFRPRLWKQLAKLFRQEQFDVLHTHDERPLIYGLPAAQWAGVPRRVHTHHHGQLGDLRWHERFLLRHASRSAGHFVCVSHDSARYVIEQGVCAGGVQTLWNGIDLTRFAYQGPCNNGPIVTVARLIPGKDIANLLRAAQYVLAAFPQTRFEIAGEIGRAHV